MMVNGGWAPHLFRDLFVLQRLLVILDLQVLNQQLFTLRLQQLCQHQLLDLF